MITEYGCILCNHWIYHTNIEETTGDNVIICYTRSFSEIVVFVFN